MNTTVEVTKKLAQAAQDASEDAIQKSAKVSQIIAQFATLTVAQFSALTVSQVVDLVVAQKEVEDAAKAADKFSKAAIEIAAQENMDCDNQAVRYSLTTIQASEDAINAVNENAQDVKDIIRARTRIRR